MKGFATIAVFLATVGALAIGSCGSSGKAVSVPVEIHWPDAAQPANETDFLGDAAPLPQTDAEH